jgi:predicted anti-sigma-YlaC factor YlaD
MNCADFEQVLDLLLEEGSAYEKTRTANEQIRAAHEHMAGCSRCRELFEISRGDRNAPAAKELPAEEREELTQAILARTCGSTCRQVEALLCDLVDGRLSPPESRLVAQHLEHCQGCTSLARILRRFSVDLPEMAEIEPDPQFVQAVLVRTVHRYSLRKRRRGRIAAWWQRQIRRPRFAIELAYCGTMLLVFFFSTPASPLKDVSPQAIRTAWTSPLESVRELRRESLWQSNRETAAKAAALGREVWEQAGTPLAKESHRIWSRVTGAAEKLHAALSTGHAYAGRVARAVMSGDFPRAWLLISDMRAAISRDWQSAEETGREKSTEP